MTLLGDPIKPGSLLKPDFPKKRERIRPEGEGQRKPREKKPGHLAAIRQCQCVSCGQDPCGEAAHLRISAPGKPITGISRKPDDRWSNPLCHVCHMKQHSMGERDFWQRIKIDPFKTAAELYHLSPDVEKMRGFISSLIHRHTGQPISGR